ncbi:MAG: sialate O-acetylesterase [Treponema sp.]|jgi:hypothetical protein|nr:sialate O-acetylesterase [Treponema sp.]
MLRGKLTAVLAFTILALGMLSFTNCDGDDSGVSETPVDPIPSVPDQNFHIYLCFGQSNMEGYNGAYLGDQKIKDEDLGTVDDRFQLLAAVDMPALGRVKDTWSTATPPLCRANTGLCTAQGYRRHRSLQMDKTHVSNCLGYIL